MSLWFWIAAAAVVSYAMKLLGYLLPESLFKDPRVVTTANYVTVGLLAALVVTNTFAGGSGVVFDARLGALCAALIALALRAPFLVGVVVGALAAAALRLVGIA